MPTSVSIIDTVTTPPLAALQQVLDTNGPYAAGDHTLSQFHTNGAFLLPAGNYDIGGTYGVLVTASTIPARAGRTLGWNDPVNFPNITGDQYEDRYAQLNLLHQLPITGAWIISQTYDASYLYQLFLWPVYLGSGGKLGLHVTPGWEVDLYFMCVL